MGLMILFPFPFALLCGSPFLSTYFTRFLFPFLNIAESSLSSPLVRVVRISDFFPFFRTTNQRSIVLSPFPFAMREMRPFFITDAGPIPFSFPVVSCTFFSTEAPFFLFYNHITVTFRGEDFPCRLGFLSLPVGPALRRLFFFPVYSPLAEHPSHT